MNKKGTVIFGAVISLALFITLGVVMVQKEVFDWQVTESAMEKVAVDTKNSESIFPNWIEISTIRADFPISIKKFIGQMDDSADLSHHSIYLDTKTGKKIEALDGWFFQGDYFHLTHLSPAGAAEYYEDLLQQTAGMNSKSPLVRYFTNLILLLSLSNFPLLIAWLFSSAIMKFSFVAFMLGIFFLLVSAQRAKAEDNFAGTSIEYSTSGAGKKNDAWMLLHLKKNMGALAILEDGKFWVGVGPYLGRGNFFSLLSLGAVTRENNSRTEIGSINAINFTLWSRGKFNYLFLGILNKPIDSRPLDFWYKNVLYRDVPTLGGFFDKARAGVRVDHAIFQEDGQWNNSFSYGPIIKLYVKKLMIQFHYSVNNKNLTTQWEMAL